MFWAADVERGMIVREVVYSMRIEEPHRKDGGTEGG